MRPLLVLAVLFAVSTGCTAQTDPPEPTATADGAPAPPGDLRTERVLATNLDRIEALAASIEAAMRPVPLLTAAQERAFDQYRNADQLAAARRLGIPQPVTPASRERLVAEGRLVRLEDNALWVVRDLDYSEPYVTPDALALLTELGERFHAALAEYDLPPLRMEVTSVLRTEASQAALRRVNPNAARGESTHQFGTTLDVTYASFRAPLEPTVALDLEGATWLEPHLRRIEALAVEAGAARMSRELQAILGHVLRAMQAEGKVMVTMEIRQPVYHFTVARRY